MNTHTVFMLLLLSLLLIPSALAGATDTTRVNQTITISEPIHGNAFLLGQTIALRSPLLHDVSAVGQYLVIDALITGKARLVGQHITINASLNDQAYIVGQHITLGEEGELYPGTELRAGTILLDGNVTGPLVVRATTLIINTTIDGSVRADVDTILFGENAQITGDLTLMKKTPINTAFVGGDVAIQEPRPIKNLLNQSAFSFPFEAFFFFLVIALLFIVISHSHVIRLNDAIERQPFLCLGVGILALVGLPFVIVFLSITLVGIPLAITLLLSYVLLILFGLVYSIIFVGTILFKTDQKEPLPHIIVAVILGGIIYFTVGELPLFGNLVWFLILAVSIGALLRVLFTDHGKKLRPEKRTLEHERTKKKPESTKKTKATRTDTSSKKSTPKKSSAKQKKKN